MTLREYLNSVMQRHYFTPWPTPHRGYVDVCSICRVEHPCIDYSEAATQLANLEASPREQIVSAETGDSFPTIYRLVPDPQPEGDKPLPANWSIGEFDPPND